MTCASCHRDIKIIARGYCRACYQRWAKRGTTDYAPKRERQFCQIDGCGKPVVTHGMCDMHRQRLIKTGTVEKSDWGAKHRHPLKHSWQWMMRHRANHPIDPRWEDFLQFVMDVGERPSPKHKLFSANGNEPLGPNNFIWKTSITQRHEGEDGKTYAARAQRVYRAVRKEAFKGYDLKKRYGLNKEQYAALLEKQQGLCAICGSPETAEVRGEAFALAVDHCHDGGHVRELLCRSCNTGLGGFRDSVDLLREAIAYLEKHALPDKAE